MQQALLFDFSKWFVSISHFAIRSLQVRTGPFVFALDLKILGGGGGLTPRQKYWGAIAQCQQPITARDFTGSNVCRIIKLNKRGTLI